NTFYMNQRGMYIDQATRNEFRHNKIVQNQIGIELWASSNEQVFTLNQITENTIPAVTLGGNSENNSWSKEGKGNDWGSTFPITDLDQDSIGDFPITYRSSLYQLIEDQELSYLFLKSPALRIYEKMNAALTKEAVMFKDPHPLTTAKGVHAKVIFLVAGLLAAGILIKGRHLLCITFGRNGRKI
ncbi:MAG: NosD domain-containing protein, partial [Bacillus sp. (in: firmicutes)]